MIPVLDRVLIGDPGLKRQMMEQCSLEHEQTSACFWQVYRPQTPCMVGRYLRTSIHELVCKLQLDTERVYLWSVTPDIEGAQMHCGQGLS